MSYDRLCKQIDTLEAQIETLYKEHDVATQPLQEQISALTRKCNERVSALREKTRALKKKAANVLLSAYGKQIGDRFQITDALLKSCDPPWHIDFQRLGRQVVIVNAVYSDDPERALFVTVAFDSFLDASAGFSLDELQAAGIFPQAPTEGIE